MGNFVDSLGIRFSGVMAHPKSEGAQSHRAVGMGHSNEHSAEASLWPGHVGLNAATEHRAILALVMTNLESRSRNAAFASQLFAKFPQGVLGTRRQPFKVLGQGILVEADRKDRLRPALGHG